MSRFEWQAIETAYSELRPSHAANELRWIVNRETILDKASGTTVTRGTIRHPGICVIVPFPDPESVLLMRQYRYAAQDYMLELPAGRIDPGESALTAAKRELLEETGYTARRWKKALFFYPSPGFLEETMTVFLASGLSSGKAQPEADEKIEHDLVPLSTVSNWIRSSRIRDAKTIASVLWLSSSRVR